MKQIELVLQNDGVKRNVIFPCTESELIIDPKYLENVEMVEDLSMNMTLRL